MRVLWDREFGLSSEALSGNSSSFSMKSQSGLSRTLEHWPEVFSSSSSALRPFAFWKRKFGIMMNLFLWSRPFIETNVARGVSWAQRLLAVLVKTTGSDVNMTIIWWISGSRYHEFFSLWICGYFVPFPPRLDLLERHYHDPRVYNRFRVFWEFDSSRSITCNEQRHVWLFYLAINIHLFSLIEIEV